MTLNSLAPGQSAVIRTVGGEGALRQHFLDMGVIPGAQITLVKFAPMGDPIEFRIHSYELTLRVDDAKQIEISAPCSAESDPPAPSASPRRSIPVWARAAVTMSRRGSARCRMERSSPLRWRAIRTAAKPPCSTS